MSDRPACYPSVPDAARAPTRMPPSLDVLTSPVPAGRFDSPVDTRHVLCLHLGDPVPVSWRASHAERPGVRLHGQFCVVPAGSSTRWTLSRPARSLLLRLSPATLAEASEGGGHGTADLAPAIHLRDPQIERIGALMQAHDKDGYPGGRLFSDSLAIALASRLLALQHRRAPDAGVGSRALPAWRLRQVIDYIEAHLADELGLAELAAVAGYSVSHFKPLFRAATGMPVHRFVVERRVARALQHLRKGGLGHEHVAQESGFAHASHMARWMRRVLGVTPAQVAMLRDDTAVCEPRH